MSSCPAVTGARLPASGTGRSAARLALMIATAEMQRYRPLGSFHWYTRRVRDRDVRDLKGATALERSSRAKFLSDGGALPPWDAQSPLALLLHWLDWLTNCCEACDATNARRSLCGADWHYRAYRLSYCCTVPPPFGSQLCSYQLHNTRYLLPCTQTPQRSRRLLPATQLILIPLHAVLTSLYH